jgi:hypothetical protein
MSLALLLNHTNTTRPRLLNLSVLRGILYYVPAGIRGDLRLIRLNYRPSRRHLIALIMG